MKNFSIINNVSEDFWPCVDAAIVTACTRAGSPSALSRHLMIDRSLLTNWKKHTRIPTLAHAIAIERLTGVSRKSVRPDIDWNYVKEEGFRIVLIPLRKKGTRRMAKPIITRRVPDVRGKHV